MRLIALIIFSLTVAVAGYLGAANPVISAWQSDRVSGAVVSCDASRSSRINRVTKSKKTSTYYGPVAVSENGDEAIGLRLGERIWCEPLIGQKVTMFVHPTNPDLNQINGYLNIWKTPTMVIFGFFFLLACIKKSGTAATFIFVSFFAGSAAWISYDYGILGKTEIDGNTRSKLALKQCIDEAVRKNNSSSGKQLIKLSCNSRGIEDLSPLHGYTSIETLSIFSNQLTDFKTLPNLPNLKELSVSGNKKLVSLDGLEGAKNLQILRAGSSNIIDIKALASLGKLVEVHLSRNPVSDFSALSGKPYLKVLLVYHTKIADLGVLYGNDELVTVGVGGNTQVTCEQVRHMRKHFGQQLTIPGPQNCI